MLFPSEDPELHAKYESMLQRASDVFEEQMTDQKRAQIIMRELQVAGPTGSLSSENLLIGSSGKLSPNSKIRRLGSHPNVSFSF